MAAGTTSLPETPGGERNWDYRYTWIRDTAFMLRALHDLGFEWEAFEYFAFMLETLGANARPAPGGQLQIMYGIGGETDLTEHTLDHLSGYRNSRPVRIGNGAFDQHQHDVWGMLLDAVDDPAAARRPDPAPQSGTGSARLVDQAIERFAEPDQGIWEMRGDPQHFVASKVMCWVAVDRGLRIARVRDDDRARRTVAEGRRRRCRPRSSTRASTTAACSPSTTTPRTSTPSNLLIPIMGFLPADDERVRATVLAIADELTQDGLVLRYRVDTTDDGLSGEEGTFTICSFWLVSALDDHRRGRPRPRAVREAPLVRRSAAPLRRGDRRHDRPAPRELPAGVHPPRAHRRRPPADRGRDGSSRDPSRRGRRRWLRWAARLPVPRASSRSR